jgi:hypothetical protein
VLCGAVNFTLQTSSGLANLSYHIFLIFLPIQI